MSNICRWTKYLLKRIEFVRRKATTAVKGNVENFFKEGFLLEVKNVVYMDEIPKDLLINFRAKTNILNVNEQLIVYGTNIRIF